jgi:REP element-mobilizing transposase RayT
MPIPLRWQDCEAVGMSRLPRPDLAGIPQHVVQRGNDRMPCFLDDEDRKWYLTALHKMACCYACTVHAFVLMTNHVHLPAIRRLSERKRQVIVEMLEGLTR